MAKKSPKNPFLISGYESPEFFCDRQEETKKLHAALSNERNVVLVSPRRMGKTGLIRHLFASIDTQEAYCIYVDIYQTECLQDFITCLGRAIIGNCGSASAREKVMQMLHALRFSFSSDPITGTPTISVNLISQETDVPLQQIFAYMENADKPIYVAIDEFQRILTYPEKNVEEILRSYIQHLRNVHFIYSGSQKHMMLDMFASAKRAFYQSAQNMHLDVIPENRYCEFCQYHLKKHQQKMDFETFHFLYDMLFAHTWYIQSIMNRLYESEEKIITKEIVVQCLQDLVEENQYTYQNYCSLLSSNQIQLLRAIAKERIVTEPYSHEFLQKHVLPATSTVRSAIKTLIEKEFLYEENGDLSVYDRFFAIWLQ